MKRVLSLALLVLMLAACNRGGLPPVVATQPATPSAGPVKTSEVQPSLTPLSPSPTPEPLAAEVNGTPITLAEFQAELSRYRQAIPDQNAAQEQAAVMNDLIDQVLLAQAAVEKGYSVDESALQQRIEALTTQLGSQQALATWIADHGYTEDRFRGDLQRMMQAAWMRDQITSGVPEKTEQVHAKQILLNDAATADQVLAELKAGGDFDTLASRYDPTRVGDLGWFPRGYLPDVKIEEAAFNLQPDEISPVIETDTGFHILKVIARDSQHPLDPDARLTLQEIALKDWLENRRSQSKIEVLLPPPS